MTAEQLKSLEFEGRDLTKLNICTALSNTEKNEFHVPLTLRRLMIYIYMEHPFLMFLDHTQRRSTVGRTPLDE